MNYISVIIPTKNRCRLLDRALGSVVAQRFPGEKFEVIVIDNGSTDNTKGVVEKYIHKNPNIKYVFDGNAGLHSCRHTGLKFSNGEILLYADDDIEAFPHWLEGVDESFSAEYVGLVGGKCVPNFESTPPIWVDKLWIKIAHGQYLPYFSLLDFGDSIREIEPELVFGCNFAIRKSLLLKINGFHPDGMPDSLLTYRGDGETYVANQVKELGFRIIYNPKASVKHWVSESRMTIDYVEKRAFMFGIGQSFADTREKFLEDKNPRRYSALWRKASKIKQLLFSHGLKAKMIKSYFEGYEFHQRAMKNNKKLLDWVLRDNYLSTDSIALYPNSDTP